MITKIEVQFAVPVELTDAEQQTLFDLIRCIARRTETKDMVHWASGIGSKPLWREPEEPGWDDSVLCITTSARERYDTEPFVERTKK